MPNFRQLAYKDRFVWELAQEAGGEVGSLAPLSFSPDAQTEFLVSLDEGEFTRLFSALLSGADLVYPEQAHQVVWDFLKFVEYPLPVPEEGDLYPTIDLFALNATPLAGVGTLTYNASTSLPFGYAISTLNTTLHGMTIPLWLAAGDYDYVGWSSLTTQGGNTGVAITDAGGVVDTIIASLAQNGAFGTRVKSTGSFTIPADAFYNLVVGNVSVAAGFQANWISHHIRKVS